MNTLTAVFPPRAPRPSYPYQHPHMYDVMLTAGSASPATTPSLVARSLASTPSTSLPEEDYHTDYTRILYTTGLAGLNLNDNPSKPWLLRSKDDAPLAGRNKLPQSPAMRPPRNHIATPYIPTVVRRRAAADPVHCGIGTNPWQPHRKWIKSFRAGSVARLASVRRHCAKEIVEAGPWDTATMSELTARFVERSAEGCSEDLAFVAPLASEVHRSFLHLEDGSAAQSFVELLKQHVLSEFRAWWLAVSGVTLPLSYLPLNYFVSSIEPTIVRTQHPSMFAFPATLLSTPACVMRALCRHVCRGSLCRVPGQWLVRNALPKHGPRHVVSG